MLLLLHLWSAIVNHVLSSDYYRVSLPILMLLPFILKQDLSLIPFIHIMAAPYEMRTSHNLFLKQMDNTTRHTYILTVDFHMILKFFCSLENAGESSVLPMLRSVRLVLGLFSSGRSQSLVSSCEGINTQVFRFILVYF